MMTDIERLRAALRLIRAAGYDPESDTDVVSDIGVGYAYDNGPSERTDVWVTGNWNEIRHFDRETGERVVTSTMPPRLAAALERLGVNTEWSDMNTRCNDCNKLIGTQPSWHGWTPQFLETQDGDTVCHDCAKAYAEDYLELYVNQANRAVTWLSESELTELEWTPYGQDGVTGFHPGQDSNPRAMVAAWRESGTTTGDYLFVVTDKGQFDVTYRLMTRERVCQHDDNDWRDDDSNVLVCRDCGAHRNPSLGPDGYDWTQ